jgi:hypothetical protein
MDCPVIETPESGKTVLVTAGAAVVDGPARSRLGSPEDRHARATDPTRRQSVFTDHYAT